MIRLRRPRIAGQNATRSIAGQRSTAVVWFSWMIARRSASAPRPWNFARATFNPSTFEILAGIHAVSADEVIVLPNSPNVILAADRAAELSEKTVAVVETRWPQAALAGYSGLVKSLLGIPAERMMVCGISFGYEDSAHPANSYRTSRAGLEDVIAWVE